MNEMIPRILLNYRPFIVQQVAGWSHVTSIPSKGSLPAESSMIRLHCYLCTRGKKRVAQGRRQGEHSEERSSHEYLAFGLGLGLRLVFGVGFSLGLRFRSRIRRRWVAPRRVCLAAYFWVEPATVLPRFAMSSLKELANRGVIIVTLIPF